MSENVLRGIISIQSCGHRCRYRRRYNTVKPQSNFGERSEVLAAFHTPKMSRVVSTSRHSQNPQIEHAMLLLLPPHTAGSIRNEAVPFPGFIWCQSSVSIIFDLQYSMVVYLSSPGCSSSGIETSAQRYTKLLAIYRSFINILIILETANPIVREGKQKTDRVTATRQIIFRIDKFPPASFISLHVSIVIGI